MLAVLDGAHHQLARRRIAADQLDDDLDVRILDHVEGVVADVTDLVQALDQLGAIVARRRAGDLEAATGAAGDLARVARQHRHRAAADGSQAQ
jgi:hypothetical protein